MNGKAKQPCPEKDSLDLSIVLSILDGSSEVSEDEIDALIRSIRTAIVQGSSKPKTDRITPYIKRDNLSGIRNGRSKKQPEPTLNNLALKQDIFGYKQQSVENIQIAQRNAATKGDAKSVKLLTKLLNKELDRIKDVVFETSDQCAHRPPYYG